MGAVNDEPGDVIVDVSDVDLMTDSSVVGKAPGGAVPFAFTPGELGAAGAPVEATTDESSVGISCGALAAGEADAEAAAGCCSDFSGSNSAV